jgi:CBS domain-containing protein
VNFQSPPKELATTVASDVMTARVISTTIDADVQSAAQLLLENHVGALPVLDGSGVAVGMASDGDMLGRQPDADRRHWWLEMLAHGAPAEPLTSLLGRSVQDVMTAPLISVGPLTPVPEIAGLMRSHRIKRLPVVRDGKMIGLVSRTDLVGLIEHVPVAATEKASASGGLFGLLGSFSGKHGASPPERLAAAEASNHVAGAIPNVSVDGFLGLVDGYTHEKFDAAAKERHTADLERARRVKSILDQRVNGEFWRELLEHAELAAKHGEKELLLLRFPSGVCSDGGREIDVGQEGWPSTLRGEAAELYARWEDELKPKGFGSETRVMSFENGMVGDYGLFLTWHR